MTETRRHAVFHPLVVDAVEALTDDSVTITFAVPDSLAAEYRFDAGQHLTLRCEPAGDSARRSYSICSPAGGALRVAVKRLPDGVFSTWACEKLRPGDVIEVMTPSGRFTVPFSPGPARHYAAIAAGSGITPVISLVATALAVEPTSRVTLVYGNQTSSSVMFLDELADLKDRYLERFSLVHVLSREGTDSPLGNGRIDAAKLDHLFEGLLLPDGVDEWFVCGPAQMTETVRAALAGRGVDEANIHRELFFVDPAPVPAEAPPATTEASGTCEITVLVDGRATVVHLTPGGETILSAILAAGRDVPYACRNGMCGTCRARVTEGAVTMDRNYALQTDEVAAGAALACQAHPASPRVTLDFDA